MKLAYLTFLYPAYITWFYQKNPALYEGSYGDQLEAISQDAFSWCGAWEASLREHGYEVVEIYSNVRPLQRAWANEHGLEWRWANWVSEVSFEQLKTFKPEVLFLDDPRTFDYRWIEQLRRECPSLRLVIGFSGTPAYDLPNLRSYDAVLASTRAYVELFKSEGCRAFYFRTAFNPRVLDELPAREDLRSSISFIGNIVRTAGYHLEREKLILRLVEELPVDLYCPQSDCRWSRDVFETAARRSIYGLVKGLKFAGVNQQAIRRLPKIGRAATWEAMPMRQRNPKLVPRMKPPVFGRQMFEKLRQSAITLNTHLEAAGSEAGNCRLFEATGVGSCLLTDWKSNLAEMFCLDSEVVVYKSFEECFEKAKWLTDHPQDREEIARNGQRRTLKDHTFQNRAIELDDIIRTLLNEQQPKRFPADGFQSATKVLHALS